MKALLAPALLLGSTAVLIGLFLVLVPFKVSWTIHFHLLWMAFFSLFGVAVVPFIPQKDLSYAAAYALGEGIAAVTALYIGGRWILSLGWQGFTGLLIFILVGMFFAGAIRQWIPETPQARIMLIQGFLFSVAGLLALASLIPPCSALQFRLRLSFCLFWLATGIYAYIESVGIVRSKALFESLDNWVCATLCILCMGGLLFSLRGQRELSRQPQLYEPAVMEVEQS